jgi:hypothetical protein
MFQSDLTRGDTIASEELLQSIRIMSFEMKIFDIFHFQTGQTIFAGSIMGKKELLKNSKVQLLIDNQKHQTIEIEGELLIDRKHPLNHRAISTKDFIDLTSEFVKKHECKLVEIEN